MLFRRYNHASAILQIKNTFDSVLEVIGLQSTNQFFLA